MADFKSAYLKTMQIEGGYANDKDDSGGETWKGISRNNHPDWAGWIIVDSYKNKPGLEVNLHASVALQQLVLSFYKTQFWDTMKLDKVNNQAIAEELFDTGVNMGDTVAVEFLQRAINATVYETIDEDGVMGTRTVDAINMHTNPAHVLKLINCLQGSRYVDICLRKPSQKKFMNSWLSRVSLTN